MLVPGDSLVTGVWSQHLVSRGVPTPIIGLALKRLFQVVKDTRRSSGVAKCYNGLSQLQAREAKWLCHLKCDETRAKEKALRVEVTDCNLQDRRGPLP